MERENMICRVFEKCGKLARFVALLAVISAISLLFSCSAVFEGGVSGKVVDAESTANPKAGIQDVEVYVYTSEYLWNEDFRLYNGTGKFIPSSSTYIGHTTTGSDGTFSLSKLMWESSKPQFGKTGDTIPVFLLFYHENYGLLKNENNAVIISDNVSYVVYQEMKAIRTNTTLNISVLDASQDPETATRLPPEISQPVNVTVCVPQATSENPNVPDIKKEATITGTGTITVSYPRYSTGTTENTPIITITYEQAGENISFKPCNYITTEGSEDFSFITDFETTPVTKTVQGSTVPIQIYMKPTVLSFPSISGQLCLTAPEANSAQETRGDEGTSVDDNIKVMLASISDSGTLGTLLAYTSATVMTSATGNGANNSRIIHGRFSGLGEGITWMNESYDGKYCTKDVAVVFDMDNSGTISTGDKYIMLKDEYDTQDPSVLITAKALRSNTTSVDIGKLTASNLRSY